MAGRQALLLFCALAMCLSHVSGRRVSHAANVTVSGAAAVDPAGGYFQLLATAGVSGISTVVTHKKTVILLDRTDGDNTHDHLANGQPAYGEEFTPDKNYFRPLDVLTNTFCSSGQLGDDGTFYSIGGTTNDPNQKLMNGAGSVRKFVPCDGGPEAQCGFNLEADMTVRRWYPTSQILPDGRFFIIGGGNETGNLAINNYMVNNPNYEFWPRKENEGNHWIALLADDSWENLPYTLYPFVHLLPSGNLFIFAGQLSVVFDYINNKVVKDLPRMQAPGEEQMYRNYPVTGTSALFALDPAKKYEASVLVCGGGDKDANILSLKGTDCPGCWLKAAQTCGLINPDGDNPQWTWENMPQARVMPDAVLLLDDTIAILNGAGVGFQGLDQTYATQAVTQPCLYDTRKDVGKRFVNIKTDSGIPRMYHSSALLMPDATVLVSGSNPNILMTTDGKFPTEFRVQTFFPPYTTWGVNRNVLNDVPGEVKIAAQFKVTFTTAIATPNDLKPMDRFRVVLANPGFSTHSSRQGMRNVFLKISGIKVVAGTKANNKATAVAPGRKSKAMAGVAVATDGHADIIAGAAAALRTAGEEVIETEYSYGSRYNVSRLGRVLLAAAEVQQPQQQKQPAAKQIPFAVDPAKKAPAKLPAAKNPAVKAPTVKKPAVKAPAVKNPAVKAPAVKKPAVKVPLAKKKLPVAAKKAPVVKSATKAPTKTPAKAKAKTPTRVLVKTPAKIPLTNKPGTKAPLTNTKVPAAKKPAVKAPLPQAKKPQAKAKVPAGKKAQTKAPVVKGKVAPAAKGPVAKGKGGKGVVVATGGHHKKGGHHKNQNTVWYANDDNLQAGTWQITLFLEAPPSGNIAPAGMYWLHVIDQGGVQIDGKWQAGYWVPNVEGAVVKLTR